MFFKSRDMLMSIVPIEVISFAFAHIFQWLSHFENTPKINSLK